MKFKIARERLLRPLGNAASVVERRQTLPILGNLFVRLEQGRVILVGTDLETEVSAEITGVDGVDGVCTVPARKFYDICRALPEDAVIEVDAQSEKVSIRSGKARFTLQALPASDFPRLEAEKWEVSFGVAEGALARLFEKTGFAMAQQDVRYYLNGCLLEMDGGILRAVATDGHRLARSELELTTDLEERRQAIVPRKAVLELSRFLDGGESEANLEVNPNHLRVSAGSLVFTSKLIDGRFPEYEKVIPSKEGTVVTVDRHGLYDVLGRTSILTNEKFRGVRLAFEEGVLRVTAHNPEQEEAADELSVEYDGEPMEIGFNVGYLMDAVRALETEQVELGVQDPNSSCTLSAPGDNKTLYLIMPMRL